MQCIFQNGRNLNTGNQPKKILNEDEKMPSKKTLKQLNYSNSFMPNTLHHGGDWKQQMNLNSQKAVLKKRKKK
ncbi:MAG: hypothetical protein A3F72_15335 [Bacteroidetes bacterium RIFCSPLOWO2_12_FULL_35_15]|nr:MAG: hypothetical protein A3F72_15335 [Bacteroidetes bacterium RIFCSPLOWO2_12_FULL_35_15]